MPAQPGRLDGMSPAPARTGQDIFVVIADGDASPDRGVHEVGIVLDSAPVRLDLSKLRCSLHRLSNAVNDESRSPSQLRVRKHLGYEFGTDADGIAHSHRDGGHRVSVSGMGR